MLVLPRIPQATLLGWLALASLVLFSTTASAQVPSQVPFQGLLLDAGGTPVNDAVDLDFELFDALLAGTSLWSESHLGVIVVDGVYSVNLGATTPLTQSVLSGGTAFLEITVSGETLVPRQQLLSVPYALVAEEATELSGVSGVFYQELISGFAFDGQPPANDHPDEGVVDVDGDGIPNFLDPDNDDDGFNDADELAVGNSINVVSPRIIGITPDPVTSWATTTLVVSGLNLQDVATVSFGAESPTPMQVSPTSFEVDVVTEVVATSQTLFMALANGETALSAPIDIVAVAPTITSATAFAQAGQPNEINITGTGFVPGTMVTIGSQVFDPSPHSDTSLAVTLAPEPEGELTITVLHPNTLTATRLLVMTPAGGARTVFLSTGTNGLFGGLAGADAICQSNAQSAGLPVGTYRAWLSDGTNSPATRLDPNVGPYELPDGTMVALNFADLLDGTLAAPINVTATGTTGVSSFVWTGTLENGLPVPTSPGAGDCDNWSNASTTGQTGRSALTGAGWSSTDQTGCTVLTRLYCFQN